MTLDELRGELVSSLQRYNLTRPQVSVGDAEQSSAKAAGDSDGEKAVPSDEGFTKVPCKL